MPRVDARSAHAALGVPRAAVHAAVHADRPHQSHAGYPAQAHRDALGSARPAPSCVQPRLPARRSRDRAAPAMHKPSAPLAATCRSPATFGRTACLRHVRDPFVTRAHASRDSVILCLQKRSHIESTFENFALNTSHVSARVRRCPLISAQCCGTFLLYPPRVVEAVPSSSRVP